MPTISFAGENLTTVFGKYNTTGHNSLQLVNCDRMPFITASVNLLDEKLESDEIAIKDYSENKGILDVLIEANIVSKPLRFVNFGFVDIPICKLIRN